MERNHLGRLIDSEESPIVKPAKPVKKIISRRFKSRDELRIRGNDEVFRERYGSHNSSSLS